MPPRSADGLAMATEGGNRRIRQGLEAVAGAWLLVLPLLRPLVWNGDAFDISNLFYLGMLASATATGLMLRALDAREAAPEQPRSRPWGWWLGLAFLAWAGVGCCVSPLPAQAWMLWTGWLFHLAAPLALWSEVLRRPQLVVAGLCAGLGLEILVMLGQVLWERPALQRDLVLDPYLVPQESMRGQYTVRVSSWRLEGTFLLANTLAAFLILLWPLVADLAWRAWATAWRWWGVALASVATLALVMTGSKAGILAWLTVLALALAHRRPRLRLWALAGLVVVVGAALAVGPVRAKAAGSLSERWGYWRGALALAAERPVAGWGLEGYAVHFPRVKPPQTEPTVAVHNEVLQAACDLGLIGALLLLAWWGAVLGAALGLRGGAGGGSSAAVGGEAGPAWPLVAAGATALAILAMGVMHPNLASYPWDAWWAWGLAYALAAAGFTSLALRLPGPSPLALGLGVATCLLHSLADFTLHSMQVVGALAWVAVLAQALRSPPPGRRPSSQARETTFALAGFLVVLLGLGLMFWGQERVVRRDRGRGVVEALRRTLVWRERGGEEMRAAALERLDLALERQGFAPLPPEATAPLQEPRVAEMALAAMEALLAASARFPADADQARLASDIAALLQQLRPDLTTSLTPALRALADLWPQEPFAVQGMAWHERYLAQLDAGKATDHLREAQTWLGRAVVLSPGYLPLREQLVAVSRDIGDQATVDRQSAELHRLAKLVHETGRATGTW